MGLFLPVCGTYTISLLDNKQQQLTVYKVLGAVEETRSSCPVGNCMGESEVIIRRQKRPRLLALCVIAPNSKLLFSKGELWAKWIETQWSETLPRLSRSQGALRGYPDSKWSVGLLIRFIYERKYFLYGMFCVSMCSLTRKSKSRKALSTNDHEKNNEAF